MTIHSKRGFAQFLGSSADQCKQATFLLWPSLPGASKGISIQAKRATGNEKGIVFGVHFCVGKPLTLVLFFLAWTLFFCPLTLWKGKYNSLLSPAESNSLRQTSGTEIWKQRSCSCPFSYRLSVEMRVPWEVFQKRQEVGHGVIIPRCLCGFRLIDISLETPISQGNFQVCF